MSSGKELYLTLPANQSTVLHSGMRHKTLLKVAIEGMNANLIYGVSPGNGQVEHKKVSGVLKFPDTSDLDRSVYVLIKV